MSSGPKPKTKPKPNGDSGTLHGAKNRTGPNSHLGYDTKHGYIEVLRGSQPITVRFQPDDIIRLLLTENPKKPHTWAHETFAMYRDGMTVAAFKKEYAKHDFLKAFDETPTMVFGAGNGRTLAPGLPGHGAWAERVREILSAHVADLGGLDQISEAERSILRRASVITIEAERLERRLSAFPPDHISRNDLALYVMLSNSLRRLLDLTGLQRREPKTLIPTITEYLASRVGIDPDPVTDVPDPRTMREAAE